MRAGRASISKGNTVSALSIALATSSSKPTSDDLRYLNLVSDPSTVAPLTSEQER